MLKIVSTKIKMKITIDGEIGEEDLALFARFLREMWRERKGHLCINIEHGLEHMTTEECQEMFKKIFTMDDKDWKKIKVTKKMYDEFQEKMRK